jgi:hypothetical protein
VHQRSGRYSCPPALPPRRFVPGVVRLGGAVHDSSAVRDLSMR